jgi:hypothetical protein
MYVRRIPELPVDGKPLGRHVRHDPRSRAYQHPAADVATLTSVRHVRGIPVLDQGQVGSCTGNAAEGAAGTDPIYAAIPASLTTRPTGDATVDEAQAVALYSAATQIDDAPGSYPPDDTGSDGLSVAKATMQAGLISGYRHAMTLEAALTALSQGPVIMGINWYDSFDNPGPDGVVTIADGAQVRGGHELVADELDVERQLVGCTNSWGESWGLSGRFYMSWATWGRLLGEEGDVTVFVPLTEPAPTPTPVPPGPAPVPISGGSLAEFAAKVRAWWVEAEAWLISHGV